MGLGNTNFGFSAGGSSTPPPSSTSWMLDGNTVGVEKYFGTNDDFSIPLYTNGTAIGILTNTGRLGIGTQTPTSKISASANDFTAFITSLRYETGSTKPAGFYGLKANGSDSSPLPITQRDEISEFGALGYHNGSAFSTQKNGNAVFYAAEDFTTTNRGTSFKIGTSPIGTTSVVYNFGVDSEGNTSMGITGLNPTARLHVQGVDSTSANYALKVDNSASAPLLYVRNDGKTGVNIAIPLNAFSVNGDIEITSNSNTLKFNNATILAVSQGVGETNIMLGRSATGTDSGNGGFIAIGGDSQSTDNSISIGLLANNSNAIDSIAIGRSATANGAVRGIAIGRNANAGFSNSFALGFNTTTTGANQFIYGGSVENHGFGTNAPLAKVHIQGSDSTSSNYALKVDNSASAPLLYVRNDGNVGINQATPLYKLDINGGMNANSYNFIQSGFASFSLEETFKLNATFLEGFRFHNTVFNLLNYIIAGNDGDTCTISNSFIKIKNAGVIDTTKYFSINVSGTPSAMIHIQGVNSGTLINQRLEPVANVTEDTTGNTVNTADATANVTAQTIAVPTDKVISIESTIVYRKTSGAGVGTTGDGTTIKLNSSVKNVAGTLTLDTVQNTYTGTTNAIVGVSATYTISGTNVLVSVTGVLNDNITWNVITKVNTVA